MKFEDFQNFGLRQFETVTAAAVSTNRRVQAIMAEATDYSKSAFEKNTAHAQKLLQIRKPDEFLELQSNFAKVAYEDLMGRATKISKLCSDLGREAFSDLAKNEPPAPSSASPATATKASAATKQN